MDTILLGVNIDHAATLRQSRYRDYEACCGKMIEPDPVAVALAAEQAGADGITAHLREDRRHMQDRDLLRLREAIQTRLNMEMAPTEEMIRFALQIRPDSVCLVPERREEVSTEGGLDVAARIEDLKATTAAFTAAGIVTSLFIDPEPKQIEAAIKIGAPCIEMHTGAYANAFYDVPAREREYARLCEAARLAHSAGMSVNAGHGINYINIAQIKKIPHLHELNIGHSILCRSILFGIGEAVREMKARMGV
ncbi:MAG: pyridoxine 5'-phosphate synthase [Opitutales bacterium]|nr:pyridoxine 5'-phosphate synthase [Opitutales bacterium]